MPTVRVHRLVVPLEFPAGLAPGAGKDAGNRLVVARDGFDRPVLRGSALAGALRHAWTNAAPREAGAVERWFGHAAKGDDGVDRPSPLRVADVPLGARRREADLLLGAAEDDHLGDSGGNVEQEGPAGEARVASRQPIGGRPRRRAAGGLGALAATGFAVSPAA